MKKRARKPAPRQNYQALWRQTEWRRQELEKQYVAAKEELAAAKQLYEKAFPQTVELYHEVRALKENVRAYKERLGNLLSAEQREAAKITGCAEDEYAIQLIRLCKQKIEEISRLTPY